MDSVNEYRPVPVDSGNPMAVIESFCDTRSLRSSRDLLWELFSAALCNNADEHFVGRQAGDWAMLYHQLDALMQAAWGLNGTKDTNPVMLWSGDEGTGSVRR